MLFRNLMVFFAIVFFSFGVAFVVLDVPLDNIIPWGLYTLFGGISFAFMIFNDPDFPL